MAATAKAQRLKQEIESCASKSGKLTKQDVLAKARDKKTVLWREFKARGLWDDKVAAETARLEYADQLIRRYVTIAVVHKNVRVSSVAYRKDPDLSGNQSGLQSLEGITDPSSAQRVLLAEIARCESYIMGARAVAYILDKQFPKLELLNQLETALESIAFAKTQVKTA